MVANALCHKEPRWACHLKFKGVVIVPGIFENIRIAQEEVPKEDHLRSEVMVKQ